MILPKLLWSYQNKSDPARTDLIQPARIWSSQSGSLSCCLRVSVSVCLCLWVWIVYIYTFGAVSGVLCVCVCRCVGVCDVCGCGVYSASMCARSGMQKKQSAKNTQRANSTKKPLQQTTHKNYCAQTTTKKPKRGNSGKKHQNVPTAQKKN